MAIFIKPIGEHDLDTVREILTRFWHDTLVVVHNNVYELTKQAGLKAMRNGRFVGCLHYLVSGQDCEIISLISLEERQGIGTALLAAVEAIARDQHCKKLTLITTNDNLNALGFYQRKGFQLAALYPGQVDVSRKIKPSIPHIGEHNIPLRDELKLEKAIG